MRTRIPSAAASSRGFIVTLAMGLLFASLTWTAPPFDAKSPADKSVEPDHAAKMAKGLDIFKKHIRPVLEKRCLKCHGGKSVESELNLADRQGLLRGGNSGPAVLVGNARDSLLYKLINHAKDPHMPHNSPKLPDETIHHFASWIDNGAPYDEALLAGKNKEPAWTQKVVSEDARQFWSFQPLQQSNPPAVKNNAWCRTPIDSFILAKLEAAGIQPNRAADKRQLLRRIYFDLVGLPPPPEEVDAFMKDTSPNAYEKWIDRLLASPQYGERWGRHWLDLARFAESHGFEHDSDRPTAYHYRDFVIKALNDDLPYDTFVKWQLAGDEFEPENNLALLATGFLAAGVHSTQITIKEVERHRYDEMDDMSATIGTAMLGLTIGCARCHDHKFDPIPQADYYRLLSTFTATVRSEIDINFEAEEYKKDKAAFDREHAPYEEALKQFERDTLPQRLAEWEDRQASPEHSFPWIILDLVGFRSEGGATFTKQDDGSLLVSGKNPPSDTYTLVAQTDLARSGITGIRLEALADPSLIKGGPGRALNGNFALSDFRVTVAPADAKDKPVPQRLRNPRATYEQKGLPVAAAIDNDEKSAWAIDPMIGKSHAASFEFEDPITCQGPVILTFTLKFKNNTGHSIGRPRLAVTTQKAMVDLQGPAIFQPILPILAMPRQQRSPEQTAMLSKWYRTIDPAWQNLNRMAQNHRNKAPKPNLVKALISSEGLPPVRLHTQGDDLLKETHFLRRGDPEQKDGVADQGFLQVLMTGPGKEKQWQMAPPKGWRTSYRRRALANWMTDPVHGAGPLLARVMVNRLWQHHLGRGIVSPPSEFGTRGEPPSHPELLDWLAAELIRHGWRLKPIHKLILTSAVYMQNSSIDEFKNKTDRENRLVWRRPVQRLEAEVIRDSLLAVSASLAGKMFGPGTLDEGTRRRSIYFTIKRSRIMPMMQVFDAPDALAGIGERPATTIAPQALLLMNNPQVRSCARNFARRVAPDATTSVSQAVGLGYKIALARSPSAEELADAIAFVEGQKESYLTSGKADSRELAMADFCQILMCLNEFVYID